MNLQILLLYKLQAESLLEKIFISSCLENKKVHGIIIFSILSFCLLIFVHNEHSILTQVSYYNFIILPYRKNSLPIS